MSGVWLEGQGMAKYQAMTATSNAVRLMLENAAHDSEWSPAPSEIQLVDVLTHPAVTRPSHRMITRSSRSRPMARRDSNVPRG
jgi:hypothetical protein